MRPHRRYGFLSAQECSDIASVASSLPTEPAQVLAGVSRHRRGTVSWLLPTTASAWLFGRLEAFGKEYADECGLAVSALHPAVQFARYPVDGHFDWHQDYDDNETPAKKITIVVQLSDATDYDGGRFELVGEQPSVFHRAQGAAVAFPTILAHKVHPVTRGLRCTLAAWMNGPRFR
jgi:PKHD-type hydroxylase